MCRAWRRCRAECSAFVYGLSNAATHSWHATSTWGFLAACAVLLTAFAFWQTLATHPLLPPRVVADRNRGGANLAMLIASAGMFGIFLFLIYYMQVTLGYSPVISGVAMLPMMVVIAVASPMSSTVLMPRFGPRPLVIAGMLCEATAMPWLTRIGPHSGYASALLGPVLVAGAGQGPVFAATLNTATFGVPAREAGVASGSIRTANQIGGSIGIALLNTIAAGATTGYLTSHAHGRPAPDLAQLAAIHGYTTVFWWCAGIFAAGAVTVVGGRGAGGSQKRISDDTSRGARTFFPRIPTSLKGEPRCPCSMCSARRCITKTMEKQECRLSSSTATRHLRIYGATCCPRLVRQAAC
jgi:hypothetical protein